MNIHQIAFIAIIVIITNFAAWRFIKDGITLVLDKVKEVSYNYMDAF